MRNSQLLKSLDRYPPFLIRALARKNGNATEYVTNTELQRRLGWWPNRVRYISERITWAGITIEDADAFAGACGVNLHAVGSLTRRLKRQLRAEHPFQAHLDTKQIATLMRRLDKWAAHRKAKGWI